MMKSKRIILLLMSAIIFSVAAVAQKPGYTRYQVTKYIDNGQVREGGGSGAGKWVKFDGNILWIDDGVTDARYVFDSRRSDGSALYYRTSWNYGTMYQGSGWVTIRDQYALVSSDRKLINEKGAWGLGTVLRIQTTDNIGGMIE